MELEEISPIGQTRIKIIWGKSEDDLHQEIAWKIMLSQSPSHESSFSAKSLLIPFIPCCKINALIMCFQRSSFSLKLMSCEFEWLGKYMGELPLHWCSYIYLHLKLNLFINQRFICLWNFWYVSQVTYFIWSWCFNEFEKGVEHFQQALEISPKSITAQFGLSSGLLGLAKECINKGAFKWASFLSEVWSCIWMIFLFNPFSFVTRFYFTDFRKHLKLQEEVLI